MCREIVTPDLEAVIALLTAGYQRDRKRSHWENVIKILTEHCPPPGLPKYGYLLESNAAPVGVLLTIFSSRSVNGTMRIRCNGFGLYVEPTFRSYAALLIRRAERHKDVTYLNITPARHTLAMVESQGYKRYTNGRFICIPLLSAASSDRQDRVFEVSSQVFPDARLEQFEADILLTHVRFGCRSLICESSGALFPFVFRLLWKSGFPLAHLAYCRDQNHFVRFAGALGCYLGKRGFVFVVLDADGAISGLVGKYLARGPRYWKGPAPPCLGDLAYTELAMFGH